MYPKLDSHNCRGVLGETCYRKNDKETGIDSIDDRYYVLVSEETETIRFLGLIVHTSIHCI